MDLKIRRIGNSLGIILPKDTLKLVGLREGDTIKIEPKSKQIDLLLKKQ